MRSEYCSHRLCSIWIELNYLRLFFNRKGVNKLNSYTRVTSLGTPRHPLTNQWTTIRVHPRLVVIKKKNPKKNHWAHVDTSVVSQVHFTLNFFLVQLTYILYISNVMMSIICGLVASQKNNTQNNTNTNEASQNILDAH